MAKNCDFSLTSVMTRAGINLEANGVAAGIKGLYKTPVTGLTGLIYTPESASEDFFQLPILFQDKDDHSAGSLQGEMAVGSGLTSEITSDLFTPPARASMMEAQAYNKAWLAFSDLITPKSNPASPTPGMAVLNLKTLKYGDPAQALDPYGMKPVGWGWTKDTPVLVGEVAAPSRPNLNGHLFRCTQSGVTGDNEPAWPTTVGAPVVDGTAKWQEMTPTYGQLYPNNPLPDMGITSTPGGGSWPEIPPSGPFYWIYFQATYTTSAGETNFLNGRAFVAEAGGGPGDQTYHISLPTPPTPPAGYPGLTPSGWNLYIAFAPPGTAGVPNPAAFQKWNTTPLAFATPYAVTQQNQNGNPPQTDTSQIVGAGRVSGMVLEQTGATYTPGALFNGFNYVVKPRYVAVMFVNRNFSVSGFTEASVQQVFINVPGFPENIGNNGFTILAEQIPTGPENCIGRIIAFTELDGTIDGPFFWIGNFAPGPDYFAFPQTTLSNGIPESATFIGDNTTTTATFSFDDSYLIGQEFNDVTDRLRVIWPYNPVDIYYSESTDRMIQTGVVGFNGHWVSNAKDPETYYVDTSFIPTQSSDGERAICAREFRGTLYSLRERSGYIMTPISDNPNGWNVTKRWDKVGPCGPRAVDVCGRFMIFVHRSGIFRYSQEAPEPVKVSKELKYWWQTINWQAQETIWCAIDEEKHCVRIGVPVGNSTVPNQEIMIYYEEGWNMPIHFSTYSGKEISMDSARRYAIQDVQANLGLRIERNIPPQDQFDLGEEGILQLDSSFYTSQFMYASAGPDGTTQSITPGIWSDNGSGIDFQYETVAPPMMMTLRKIEGFNLNARGLGQLFPSFLAGRAMVTDWNPDGSPAKRSFELKCRAIDLVPNQSVGISRWAPAAKINERWRLRFTNGKVPGAWAELKYAALYSIPWSSGRGESELGG